MSVLTSGPGGCEEDPAARTRELTRSRLWPLVAPWTRARWAIAVAMSLVIHALVTFFWRLPAPDRPGVRPPQTPAAPPIAFEPSFPPPVRRPRVVVVGPEARGGSLGGRAPTSTGPLREPPRAMADVPAADADAVPGAPAPGQPVPPPGRGQPLGCWRPRGREGSIPAPSGTRWDCASRRESTERAIRSMSGSTSGSARHSPIAHDDCARGRGRGRRTLVPAGCPSCSLPTLAR